MKGCRTNVCILLLFSGVVVLFHDVSGEIPFVMFHKMRVFGGMLFFRMAARSRLVLPAVLAAAIAVASSFAQAEVRGLWVVRDALSTRESVTSMVEFAARNRFNVLFVQIRGRADAYYNSYFVPGPEGKPSISSQFDPLEETVRLAHEQGIEVHAWLNMYLAWSADNPPSDPSHPLNEHPDWFMVSIAGENMATAPIGNVRNNLSEGRYLSPCLEEVRSYMSRVITEIIVSYNIDGIHLDYVRYPGRNYDFHPMARYAFHERNGIDPVEVVNGSGEVDPALVYLGKWVDFRAEQIDSQIRSIKNRIDLVDPRIRFSAAVKPHADEALFQFGQNWAGWLNEGLMDFVVPMSYYPDNEQLNTVMRANLEKVKPEQIVGGVGIYRIDPNAAAGQIRLFRELGLSGYCLFSYTTFQEISNYAGSLQRLIPLSGNGDGLPQSFRPYIRNVYE